VSRARWPSRPEVARGIAPLLAGAIGCVILQLTEPQVLVYVSASAGAVVAAAGLACAAVVIAVPACRRRAAATAAEREAAVSAAIAVRLREAAEQATRDRVRFLARLDHELKNPLTAMHAGLANVDLACSCDSSANTAAALASVSAQADRIGRLLSDLRKLAELETAPVEAAPVDIPGLLTEVAEAAVELPGGAERVIRVSVPEVPWPLPPVRGDRDLLFVALQNLAANAVKFSAPRGTVEMRASEDGDAVLVEVADTGTGIPGDEIGEVWQELARGRAARSLPGTGIGLALVRVIVARHGGRVAIRSRDGQGTVVSLWLPAATVRPDTGRPDTAPRVATLRRRRDTQDTAAL
jgi:two-component system, OmpR family, sensor kinase